MNETDTGTTLEPMVTIQGLHKSFGDLKVLSGLDIVVGSGEVVVIIGPSGSGKSTLLTWTNYKFKNGSFAEEKQGDGKVMIETQQCENIFNFNYTIYEDSPCQSLRICEHEINNIQDKSYFYRIKQNKPNEAFLFNPSNLLHFRPNQYNGLSIRGDMRIIELNDYQNSNLQVVTGPRMNSNVCFGTLRDCKSTNAIYSVFSDKIYE